MPIDIQAIIVSSIIPAILTIATYYFTRKKNDAEAGQADATAVERLSASSATLAEQYAELADRYKAERDAERSRSDELRIALMRCESEGDRLRDALRSFTGDNDDGST